MYVCMDGCIYICVLTTISTEVAVRYYLSSNRPPTAWEIISWRVVVCANEIEKNTLQA